MDAIDLKARARLRLESGDSVREGTVRELVHHVALLSAGHRAGAVLELPGGGALDLDRLLELAAREDLGD